MTTLGLRDLGFMGTVGAVAAYDSDAQAYITAVETADGQALETAVRNAINAFVVGCKADGIWAAIKASCILAGARTLSGALVPLVGAAPTPLNFVSGDYSRKTGLKGSTTTGTNSKRLNTNRNNDADPQNSKHMAAYRTETASMTVSLDIALGYNVSGTSGVGRVGANTTSFAINSSALANVAVNASNFPGLIGASRVSSSSITARYNSSNSNLSSTSGSPLGGDIFVFGIPSINSANDARLAFYSIGESLDLALLDTRVTTLINAIATAIP